MGLDYERALGFAAAGGVILGLSTTFYLAMIGRVTGISGTFKKAWLQSTFQASPDPLHLIFFGGLLCGGAIMRFTEAGWFEQGGYNTGLMVVSGLLVGFGTTLGSGCTSGHGLCGLARFSKRSLAAVCTFFSTAVFIASSLWPIMRSAWQPSEHPVDSISNVRDLHYLSIGLGCTCTVFGLLKMAKEEKQSVLAGCVALACSIGFACGLCISGMVRPTKVHSFLALNKHWDPSLAFVLGGGLAVNILAWPIIMKWRKPILCQKWDLPTSTAIDLNVIVGGVLFGVGWGVGGVCPGPGLVGIAGPYGMSMLLWCFGCLIGSQLMLLVKKVVASQSGESVSPSVERRSSLLEDGQKDGKQGANYGARSDQIEHADVIPHD